MTRRFAHYRAVVWITAAIGLPACDVWQPWPPTNDQLDKGLVVLYPGSFNSHIEMLGFFYGLQTGGIDQAIEITPWASFLDHVYDPIGAQVRDDQRAHDEAARLAAYKAAHPGQPVTLLGYSGGCWFAVLTAERMPEGVSIDRVILMSASIEKSYDLSLAISHTTEGIVHFWSPKDQFTRDVSAQFDLADSTKGDPAASFGFNIRHDRLIQIEWDPSWEQYGYYGGHDDYLLLVGWIGQFVAPWVAKPPLPMAADVPSKSAF